MTYQLSRLRLANVGDRAARFTDLTLDVSSSAGGSCEPVDSILWLRNGGGKSSLLSLFFALLLPLRKDFMGRSVKRYLEDYIASGDTSHTVAEWVAQSGDSLLPPPRLVTGAIYEWVDRRKPVDPDRDREKLRGWYYSFFEVPGVLDLDLLPIHDEAGRARPMSEFVRLLREAAAARPQQLSFAITDQRGMWSETLITRNLDPTLFGYQKEMNHSEGGVAELFNFPSTDKFIDFLIDLTVDSAQPELVAANLRKVIDVLGRKPDLLVDRDFCAEISGRLDTLAERHGLAEEADREAGEARQAAAMLAAAFQSAASAQETDTAWFAGEAKRLRGEAHRLDSERGRVNDIANELLRIAATYRLADVTKAAEEAKSAATATKDDDLAWEAVGPLAERAEAEDQARSVRRQMSEAERESAPLRKARDDAAAALKARYAALAGDEGTAEAQKTSAAETASSNAETEEESARANRELSIKAEERADNLRLQLANIDEAIETAIDEGDLPDREAVPAEVLGTSRTAKNKANGLLATVRKRRADRPALRAALSEQRRALATERAARNAERDQLVSDHEKLSARVDMLATHARFAELMELGEDGRLDLWAEAADLRAALTHAVSTAESVIMDTRVDAADDDRALDGLRTDAFLPTTRDAQRVAEVIAGEVSARPGWELLRDLVTEPARADVLRNAIVAEIAAGVVVADTDLDKALLALEKQGCRSIAHVTVCTATQMQQALNAAAPEWSAVPSDPALYDPTAAEHARAERERRRHEQERRIAELRQQTQVDRTLLEVLESLLRDCPTGYLHTLELKAEECRRAIDTIDHSDAALVSQIDELEAHDLTDAATEQRLSDELNSLTGRIERLTALVAKVSRLPELKRDIEQRDRDVMAYTQVADEAATRANEWRKTERAAEREAAEHKLHKERYEREGRAISMLDADREHAITPGDDPLSVLTSRFNALDTQWQTVAAQSVLAERLAGLTSRRRRAEQALAEYPKAILERAASLLETGDGQDPERRAIARRRSRAKADEAQQALSRALLQLEQARDEVTERTPRDRPRHAQLDVVSAGEAEARELAAIQAATATDMSGRVTALNREAHDADSAASEADTAAKVLAQRAHRLADAAAPTGVVNGVAAFDGDDARAEAETRAVLGRLTSTMEIVTAARNRTNEAIDAVRRLASEARFSGIPDAIRDRFTSDDPLTLGERAAARAEEMRTRRTTIDGQLADIGRDQQLVVVEIAALVQDVLANLESAHRHSKLPGTLGGWADQHFLRIRFARPSSEEDLRARIGTVVDRIVAEKSKPEAFALLKRCVHEAVAPRGFSVKVLKPNSDLAVEPVDVTRLGKFSGGEKLTVCVALYCTLARLRAVNRGRGRAALGGTLVLDNPLGTASHVALLRLQREVATAHGVQLVYTTGVEDLGAVGQFPNVLRMRNAPGALRTRRYVVLEERFGSAVEGITSVRLTRDETTDGAAS